MYVGDVCCASMDDAVDKRPPPTSMTSGPFLESSQKFSGPKSHVKNHEALDVQSFCFYFKRFCILKKLTLMQRFESKNRFVSQLRTFKVEFSGTKRLRVFRETGSWVRFPFRRPCHVG